METENQVQFMMRVKLPNPSGFAACPSGDTDYEVALQNALMSAKPQGFEIKYPRSGQSWPVDSEGYTFVTLYLYQVDAVDTTTQWIERYGRVTKELSELRAKVKELAAMM